MPTDLNGPLVILGPMPKISELGNRRMGIKQARRMGPRYTVKTARLSVLRPLDLRPSKCPSDASPRPFSCADPVGTRRLAC